MERCLRYNCNNNSFAVSQFCTVRRCEGGGVVKDKNMMICSSLADAIELLMAPLVVLTSPTRFPGRLGEARF